MMAASPCLLPHTLCHDYGDIWMLSGGWEGSCDLIVLIDKGWRSILFLLRVIFKDDCSVTIFVKISSLYFLFLLKSDELWFHHGVDGPLLLPGWHYILLCMEQLPGYIFSLVYCDGGLPSRRHQPKETPMDGSILISCLPFCPRNFWRFLKTWCD